MIRKQIQFFVSLIVAGVLLVAVFVRSMPAQGLGVGVTLDALTAAFVFSSDRDGNSEIYFVEGMLGEPRNLTRHPALDEQPRWSPDGRRIAFVSARDGARQIYVMNADGSSTRKLTSGGEAFQPAWSPAGDALVYVASSTSRPPGAILEDATGDLHVVDAHGSHPRRLPGSDGHAQTPVWSPDGTRITFSREAGAGAAIQTMSIDGSDLRTLTHGEFYDLAPAYSPNGDRIVYESRRGGRRVLATMRVDGSEARILGTPEGASMPRWSPRHSLICFTAATGDLFAVSPDGNLQAALTRHRANDRSCDWSPVGSTMRAELGARLHTTELSCHTNGSCVRR